MIPNNQIKLLECWKKDIFAELSITEIMNLSKRKTKTWVFNTLKNLVNNRLLNLKTKANINIYTLNTNNPLTFTFLTYIDSQENLKFEHINIISDIISKAPINGCSIIIFGSYANKSYTKKSDLDICILIPEKELEKKIKPYINDIKLEHAIIIDDHYIQFNEFKEMLLRDEENLGKQIYLKHKIFLSPDIYYQLIIDAHKHGFKT